MSSTVVGIDSSTQSCKVVVVDTDSGQVLASGSAAHPDGTSADPAAWLDALRTAWREAGVPGRDDIVGVSVAGQQHGMVAVDTAGTPVRDALLWNDVRSAPRPPAWRRSTAPAGGWSAWAWRPCPP